MKVLHVAEKPSVAKEIARILSSSSFSVREGYSPYNKIFQFRFGNDEFLVTSVSGHLLTLDFPERFQKWNAVDPAILLDPVQCPVVWKVGEQNHNGENLRRTLAQEGRSAHRLVLWLDCDSEGEAIADEVAQVVREVNPAIMVGRAQFSAVTYHDITGALSNLREIDRKVVQMVRVRQEIDLRSGAAFTRLLTMKLEGIVNSESRIISYGTCQFPTLGLVVARFLEIKEFHRETFYSIELSATQDPSRCNGGPPPALEFTWVRGRLFCQYTTSNFYDLCFEAARHEGSLATAIQCDRREKRKWRPLPLNTVELQKEAVRKLKIDSSTAMDIAEALYNAGLISYPRTETDRFSQSIDVRSLVEIQCNHPDWGNFASGLRNEDDNSTPNFQFPRSGRNDDQAHPPIHPTSCKPLQDFDNPLHRKMFDYITRRFLASCSEDAIGAETIVTAAIGMEEFTARGLTIVKKGYLQIFENYDRWVESELPYVEEGDCLPITRLELRQGETSPPPLLNESDLIALMDKYGIGTDATIAEHIKTIQTRNYVVKNSQGRFAPQPMGLALVESFEHCEAYLARPGLRADQERDLKKISTDSSPFEEILSSYTRSYATQFQQIMSRMSLFLETIRSYFSNDAEMNNPSAGWIIEERDFSQCGLCGTRMTLMKSSAQTQIAKSVNCDRCTRLWRVWRASPGPSNTAPVIESTSHICPLCNFQVLCVRGNQEDGRHSSHFVCPKCYNEPPVMQDGPHNPENRLTAFQCGHCTHPTCGLASGTPPSYRQVMKCPACEGFCSIRVERERHRFRIACAPPCSLVYFFPSAISTLTVPDGEEQRCSSRSCAESRKLLIRFQASMLPPGAPREFEGCIWCDPRYQAILISMGESLPDLQEMKRQAQRRGRQLPSPFNAGGRGAGGGERTRNSSARGGRSRGATSARGRGYTRRGGRASRS